jgi:hypothetical protein
MGSGSVLRQRNEEKWSFDARSRPFYSRRTSALTVQAWTSRPRRRGPAKQKLGAEWHEESEWGMLRSLMGGAVLI